jgi:hypothetical protein
MTLLQELELADTLQDYIGRLGVVHDWSDYMYYVCMPEVRVEHCLILISLIQVDNI